MSPRRILVIDSERVWRGGQQQIFTLIEGISSRHEILLAAPAESPLTARVREIEFPTRDFRQRNEFSPMAFLRVLRMIREWSPALVHFNTPKPVLMGGLAARLSRTRPLCIASRRVVFPLASPLSRFKYSHLLDLTLTVSESIREGLIRAGVPPDRVKTVHEGVAIPDTQTGSPERRKAGLRPIIGTVAHLSHEKGQETLLRAAARLQADFPEIRVVLVGDGEERSRLERLTDELQLRDLVEFWGFREDADELTADFDIFTLPSLSEGLSSAILAAMARGCPIVASDVGGNGELVRSGVNGYLVPPDDPAALSEAIAKLLRSATLREEMGAASLERVKESFTLQAKIDGTLRAYEELLTDRPFR